MTPTRAMAEKRGELLSKSWKYLADNFHKFDEDKKIKIALELCKKNIPTVLDHTGKIESALPTTDKQDIAERVALLLKDKK